MANIIKPKTSSVAANVPTTTNLADGEFCINTTDKIIYQRVGASIAAVANYQSPSVTSVALTAPSIFSVTGSPVTTAGTLALALANQTGNSVFASPSAGTAGAPLFRALVAADIPNLDAGKITTGIMAAARLGTGATASNFLRGDGTYQTPFVAATSPGGSTTQVQFNSSGAFAGDSNLVWDNTNKRLGIGGAASNQLEITGSTTDKAFYNQGTFAVQRTGANYYNSPSMEFQRAAGTLASPTAPSANDWIGDFFFRVWNGSAYAVSGGFGGVVENSGGGMYLAFRTDNTPSGALTERMRITANGNILIGTAALATTATNGFFYFTTSAGAPTGVPTAYAGRVALHYDTTNNKIYVYNGAWKSVTLA